MKCPICGSHDTHSIFTKQICNECDAKFTVVEAIKAVLMCYHSVKVIERKGIYGCSNHGECIEDICVETTAWPRANEIQEELLNAGINVFVKTI